MQTAEAIYNTIHEQAVEREPETVKPRVVEEMTVGQWFRQGDVYVTKVSDKAEQIDDYTVPTTDRQVAFGTTKGSRHILADNPTLKIFKKESPSELEGPMFYSEGDIALEHPEHADFHFPAGTYKVDLQRDYAFAELKRARD